MRRAVILLLLIVLAGCGADSTPTLLPPPVTLDTFTPTVDTSAPATITALSAQLATAQIPPTNTAPPARATATSRPFATAIPTVAPIAATEEPTQLPSVAPTLEDASTTEPMANIPSPTREPRDPTAIPTPCLPERDFLFKANDARNKAIIGWNQFYPASQDFNYPPYSDDKDWARGRQFIMEGVAMGEALSTSIYADKWAAVLDRWRQVGESTDPNAFKQWQQLIKEADDVYYSMWAQATAVAANGCF